MFNSGRGFGVPPQRDRRLGRFASSRDLHEAPPVGCYNPNLSTFEKKSYNILTTPTKRVDRRHSKSQNK